MASTLPRGVPYLVVAGPASLRESAVIFQSLDGIIARMEMKPELLLVERTGINQLLLEYGRCRNLDVRIHHTQVLDLGPSMPFLRNQEIIEVATHLVVFWDGHCQHTSHLMELARMRDKPVCVLYTDNPDER